MGRKSGFSKKNRTKKDSRIIQEKSALVQQSLALEEPTPHVSTSVSADKKSFFSRFTSKKETRTDNLIQHETLKVDNTNESGDQSLVQQVDSKQNNDHTSIESFKVSTDSNNQTSDYVETRDTEQITIDVTKSNEVQPKVTLDDTTTITENSKKTLHQPDEYHVKSKPISVFGFANHDKQQSNVIHECDSSKDKGEEKMDQINNAKQSVLAKGVVITGDISTDGDIIIEGSINGNLTSAGNIIVNENAEITGNISGENLSVSNGHIQGDISVDKNLTISKDSSVEGNIIADNFNLSGQVVGNVQVSDTIALASTALINGDVETNGITVELGAAINGKIAVNPKKADVTSTPVDKTVVEEVSETEITATEPVA